MASKEWRERNPIRYAFQTTKDNAKRRGIAFLLTFTQFEKFAIKVELIGKRGRKKDSYHIDRKDERKGYIVGNIQLITCSENIAKSNKIQIRKRKIMNKFGQHKYITEREEITENEF